MMRNPQSVGGSHSRLVCEQQMNMTNLASCCLALLAVLPLRGLAAPVQDDHIEAELVAENLSFQPGADNWVALRLRPEAGWHVYWRNPGDSGLPTRLHWQLPAGVTAGEMHWPLPHEHSLGDLTNYGYGEETLHLVPLSLSADVRGEPLKLLARAEWLVCADVCIPGKADLSLEVPVSPAAPQPHPDWRGAFAAARAALPQPATFPGRFHIEGGELRLAAGPLPGDSEQVAFFPYGGDLVNHAAPQRLAWEGRELRLAQPLSAYYVEAPQAVAGVIVVGEGKQARAYELTAQPGEVAAVPAPAGAVAAVPHGPAPAAGEAPPGLPLVLLFAVLGGLILNLMPCVFPVLSLKALSVMQAQGQAAAEHRRHALAYTGGVLATFGLVAGALIALRAGGAALGWGFQLQSPLFVGLLVYVMFGLGLSLSGVVQFGTRWMGAGQNLAAQSGLAGSFFTGVLAVVVASPCTAPFMGTALGFALTQPAAVSVAVFIALGLGLALPFLLLGFVPRLAAWLPRPGAWMETLKQVLAFPLYLTAVWLLWVLGGLTDRNGMALALIGLVLLAFGFWLVGAGQRGPVARGLGWLSALAAVAVLFHPVLAAHAPAAAGRVQAAAGWEPYSDARLEQLRAEGRTVFVDFTADWCISCKVNERVVIRSDSVQRAFAQNGVALLLADWTRSDPAITATLQRYGRSGVPLYLVSKKGAEPVVLPQVLTPDLLVDAVTGG